jgi:catechol 2,3-dioxygenase
MLDDPKQNAKLDHLMLSSQDPDSMTDFYARVMDYQVTKSEGGIWLCEAPGRKLLVAKGENKGLVFVAYSFSDYEALEALRQRLKQANYIPQISPSPIFDDKAFAIDDPDGNTLVFGVAVSETSVVPGKQFMSARLQHMVVASDELTPMVAFYTEVLGAVASDMVYDDEGDLTACFMRTDREHHSFAVFRAPGKRLDHHCYEVRHWNDIRDWADRATALDIPIEWGPGRHGAGNNLFIFVHDPDGNWVELSAELEQVEPYSKTGKWKHEPRTLNLWGMAKMRS